VSVTHSATVRPARADDDDSLFALLVEFASSYAPGRAAFDAHLPMLVDSDTADLLVAEVDGRVAGYALAFDLLTLFANGVVTELQELFVTPTQRRRRIGRQLVHTIVDRARARGAVEVTVPTRRAGDFYLRLGFEQTASYFKLRLSEAGGPT
jgi:GNAT superfamily N-acetyltransferase